MIDLKITFYKVITQKSVEDICKSQGWDNCLNKIENDKTSLSLKTESNDECIYHNGKKLPKVNGKCQKFLYFNRCKYQKRKL